MIGQSARRLQYAANRIHHDARMSYFRTDYCIFIQFKAVLTQEVRMTLVLLRTINARNIELHHDTRGETVGVLIRGGEYRYLPWLGFVERDRALRIGKPVKLRISRVGLQGDFATTWTDVEADKHVLGCRTGKGVYAVVEQGVRFV